MDGDVLAEGSQVLTTEGVCRDVIQGLLLQRIDRGEIQLGIRGVLFSCLCAWGFVYSLSFLWMLAQTWRVPGGQCWRSLKRRHWNEILRVMLKFSGR